MPNNELDLLKEKTKLLIMRFNPNHGKDGKFTTGHGGSGGGSSGDSVNEYKVYSYSSDVEKGQPSVSYSNNVKSKEQKEAIKAYTSIVFYEDDNVSNFRNINNYLTGKRSFNDEARTELDSTIKVIDSTITGKTDSNMMVYRGIAVKSDEINIGDSISNLGFTSTSISKDISVNYAEYYEGVTISIKVPAGTRALFIGSDSSAGIDEGEMLFGRGAKITIISKKDNEVIGELSYEN